MNEKVRRSQFHLAASPGGFWILLPRGPDDKGTFDVRLNTAAEVAVFLRKAARIAHAAFPDDFPDIRTDQ